MISTNLVRLNDMVRMTCGGALDGVIRMEMFNAFKEWFQRTDSWLLEVPIYIQRHTNDYQIGTGQNVSVTRVDGLGSRYDSPLPADGLPTYLPMCPPQFLSISVGRDGNYQAQDPVLRAANG